MSQKRPMVAGREAFKLYSLRPDNRPVNRAAKFMTPHGE